MLKNLRVAARDAQVILGRSRLAVTAERSEVLTTREQIAAGPALPPQLGSVDVSPNSTAGAVRTHTRPPCAVARWPVINEGFLGDHERGRTSGPCRGQTDSGGDRGKALTSARRAQGSPNDPSGTSDSA